MTLFDPSAINFSTHGVGDLTDAISCVVSQQINGEYELLLKYPITGIHYSDIALRSIISAKTDAISDNQPFRVYRITKPLNGIVTIYARHIAYDMSGIIVSPFEADSIGLALQSIVSYSSSECPFTFFTDKSISSPFKVSEPTNMWALLGGSEGSLLDTYHGEWEFDGYTANLWTRRGADRGVSIRYGKNMTDLEQDSNCSNVYTGIYPYWYDEETGNLVELPEKILNADGSYGYTKNLSVNFKDSFENAPTIEQLRERGKKYIADNDIGIPTVSWKVEFVMLEQSEEYKDKSLLESVFLGDAVTVEFEKLGVSATARVVEIEYDAILNRYNSVTLGNVKSSIADTIVSQQKALEQKPSKSIVENIVHSLTDAFIGANGGCVRLLDTNGDNEPDELYVADNTDPQQAHRVWRFNNQGWAASENGYNGPFTLGATLEGGILANAITAANLTAGTIKSQDGQTFYLNLDEGILKIAALTALNDYIQTGNIGTDDSGNPIFGVKIGKTDLTSAFKSVFTATALEFYESNELTTFLSNRKLNTNTIRTAMLELVSQDNMANADSVDWQVTLDNGFTIRYVGEEDA